MNGDKISNLVGQLSTTHTNGKMFSVPSGFIDYLKNNGVSSAYNTYYICRFNDDYLIFLSTDTNTWGNINHLRAFYINDEYKYFYDDLTLNGSDLAPASRQLIQNNCFNIFYSDFSIGGNLTYFANLNTNNYDDLVNSKAPSEYIISMLYLFIPLLLFIFGIKVVRKGLFK